MNKLLRNKTKSKTVVFGAFLIGSFSVLYFGVSSFTSISYNAPNGNSAGGVVVGIKEPKKQKKVFVVTHINIPESVKGIYMTACVASTPSFRGKLVALIDETELNSVIIDIKDYTGTISFKTDNPVLRDTKGVGCVAGDMRKFIDSLHKKQIYVIGRITVFQDPYYANKHPDLAVKKESTGAVWKDHKGISYIDAGAKEFWDYIVELSKESYAIGFDELNYDYIRFPSDGNMKDIFFPFSEKKVIADPAYGKAEVIKDFAKYLNEKLNNTKVVLSADLFGMSMTNNDDLNIGQVLEFLAPYFDYIAPMVYPSHYPSGFHGYKKVNEHPYDIVKFSMDRGSQRLIAASSTPNKLRPWLQDNDYPVRYTPEMIRAQIQATYDAGLKSWMLWDAANTYTKEALLEK
jgi:hypothetical protein